MSGKDGNKLQIDACRGIEGNCRNALMKTGTLQAEIEKAAQWASAQMAAPAMRHPVKIAIAACPNACCRPQIKDVGFIAYQSPAGITDDCNVCEVCIETCRENALIKDSTEIRRFPEYCLGCGWCLSTCPQKALFGKNLVLRVLAGGKLGRHPVLAREFMDRIIPDKAPELTASILQHYLRSRKNGERVADTLSRIGKERITGGLLCD